LEFKKSQEILGEVVVDLIGGDVRNSVLKMGWLSHIFVLACLGYVSALPLRSFYNYGAIQGDTELGRYDDTSSPEIQLNTPMFFYDGMYTSVFVSIREKRVKFVVIQFSFINILYFLHNNTYHIAEYNIRTKLNISESKVRALWWPRTHW